MARTMRLTTFTWVFNQIAIALNAESAVVATSRGYVRVFSQSGIQTALFSVGSVISAAGKDDMILLIHHQGEPFEGKPWTLSEMTQHSTYVESVSC